MYLLVWVFTCTTNTVWRHRDISPPYWRENFFMQSDLPDSLKDKSLDSLILYHNGSKFRKKTN